MEGEIPVGCKLVDALEDEQSPRAPIHFLDRLRL